MKELLLKKEVYSPKTIDEAIDAYVGYAKMEVADCGDYVRIRFSKCRYDETRTVKEFENYVIGLENS